MTFGEWCATVLAVIIGGAAAAAFAGFIFLYALRWPIVVIAALIVIFKMT
ncbi:MAG: hypothetical protein ACPGQQ_02670 [Candidatus Puniceispirillaceae bacterium]